MAVDPAATSQVSGLGENPGWQNTRWFGGSPATGTHAQVSGASDGPLEITTYIRKAWTAAPPAIGNSGDSGFGLTGSGPNGYPVVGGSSLAISCYVRPSVKRNMYIGVYQYAASGASYSTARIYGSNVSVPAGQWVRVSLLYTVPSGVGRVAPVCDAASSGANGAANWAVGSTLDGTGLMITLDSALYTYGDGNFPGWSWDGTPNNSTSFGPAKVQ